VPAKLMLTDWRGPQAWSGGDLARSGALASVSTRWASKPMAGVTKTVFGCQPGFALYLNDFQNPGGGQNLFDREVAMEGVSLGYDLWTLLGDDGLVKPGRRLCNFDAAVGVGGAPGVSTFIWNLTRPVVARWFAAKLDQYFAHMDGWMADYYTGLEYLLLDTDPNSAALNPGIANIYHPAGPAAGWALYQRGYARCIHEYRRIRSARGAASTLVVGQQYHNVSEPWTREINGRFVEQYPWLWSGATPWQTYHGDQMDQHATWSRYTPASTDMVIELADRGTNSALVFSVDQRNAVMAYANTRSCYVSWGRDSLAGVGWPG